MNLRGYRLVMPAGSVAVAAALLALWATSGTTGAKEVVAGAAPAGSPAAVVAQLVGGSVQAQHVAAGAIPPPATLPAADTPSCPDPFFVAGSGHALPAPTFPNGTTKGFGVPFVAALTGGELLTGFDEKWNNQIKTFKTPWRSVIGPEVPPSHAGQGIDGWVAGVLQVPQLTASKTEVVFCNGPSDPVDFTVLNEGRVPPLENYGATPFPLSISLVPGPASLAVTGVTPAGALELSGTATATTSATFNHILTCHQVAPTSITVSSSASQPLTQPGGPPVTGLDARFTPTDLVGAFPGAVHANPGLAPATANVAADDFVVPLFDLTTCAGSTGPAAVLNDAIEGWDAQDCPFYGNNPIDPCTTHAPGPSLPGWSQFQITATIAYLGLSAGVPAGFGS